MRRSLRTRLRRLVSRCAIATLSHAVPLPRCAIAAQSLPGGGCWVCRLKHAGVDGSVESEVNRLWEKLLLSLVDERAAKPYLRMPTFRPYVQRHHRVRDTHSHTHRCRPTA